MPKSDVLINPFQVGMDNEAGRPRRPLHWLEKPLARISGLQTCARLYAALDQRGADSCFAEQALATLGVTWRTTGCELDEIPAEGPLVIVANHPFGGLEGLVLMAALNQLRPDVKLLANHLLWRIPEMRDAMIPLDPFQKPASRIRNIGALRQAKHWLKQGGAVVIFPAGEVSHFHLREPGVVDPPWQNGVERLVQGSGAAVIPIFFRGRNRLAFQLAGMVHPRLRTLMLPRQLLDKEGLTVSVVIGRMIPSKRLQQFGQSGQLTAYLRLRTYLLAGREIKTPIKESEKTRDSRQAACRPIVPPVPPEVLSLEIAELPSSLLLHCHGPQQIWCVEARQAPAVMREIGRLREVTFRMHQEGTGLSLDLDTFDDYYRHLFLWHSEKKEIIGAYRIGDAHRILQIRGLNGLYTHTLFRFQAEFFAQTGPALELGRSFVRREYQRSFSALLLLWQGIGRYVAAHPEYRILFGPVSISRSYSDFARQLMTSTLSRQLKMPDLDALVTPRLPAETRQPRIKGCSRQTTAACSLDILEVDALLAEIDGGGRGLPVLIRHYLNLGGKILGFNLDPAFSDVVDGLILVDLDVTDPKVLKRYMGREGYGRFAAGAKAVPFSKVA